MAYLSYSTSFNGTTDYLSIPTNAAFSFGTGDFTIEGWIYTGDTSVTGGYSRSICGIGNLNFYLRINQYHGGTTGALRVTDGTVQIADGSTINLATSSWHHFAVVRQSGTAKMWIDGAYQTGAAYTTSLTNTNTNIIGAQSNPTEGYFNGYISNIRVVKGTAVYTGTSNFTPSTLPLDTIPNMSLLACRSATATDVSTNNFTITTVGSPTVTNTNTPFSVASAPVTPTTYTKQIPSVVSTTNQSTELTSLDDTSIQTSTLSTNIPYKVYIPSVSSTTKQTTELTSLDSTNNYSTAVAALVVGKKELPSVISLTRFSTFIKTAEDPITDSAAAASVQTWSIS